MELLLISRLARSPYQQHVWPRSSNRRRDERHGGSSQHPAAWPATPLAIVRRPGSPHRCRHLSYPRSSHRHPKLHIKCHALAEQSSSSATVAAGDLQGHDSPSRSHTSLSTKLPPPSQTQHHQQHQQQHLQRNDLISDEDCSRLIDSVVDEYVAAQNQPQQHPPQQQQERLPWSSGGQGLQHHRPRYVSSPGPYLPAPRSPRARVFSHADAIASSSAIRPFLRWPASALSASSAAPACAGSVGGTEAQAQTSSAGAAAEGRTGDQDERARRSAVALTRTLLDAMQEHGRSIADLSVAIGRAGDLAYMKSMRPSYT